MKFSLLLPIVFFIITTGCNQQSKDGKSRNETGKNSYDSIPPKELAFAKFTDQPKGKIDSAEASLMHIDYLKNPITNLIKPGGGLIRGWYMDQEDFNVIKANATKGARIYLGYKDNEYHLIMVAVRNDSANVLSSPDLEASDPRVVVDDFKPCPDQCPADKSISWKPIWKYDLNFLGLNAQGHHRFQNFSGFPEIIRQ
jgi:hypothetical protein